MKVWMRGRWASLTAPQAASMSALWVRARPQITGPSTLREISCDRLEVAGRGDREAGLDHVDAEPRPSCWAISTFSAVFSEIPGDCSPSLRVVSKMWTRFASDAWVPSDLLLLCLFE